MEQIGSKQRNPSGRGCIFDLPPGGGGTDLRWTLYIDEPVPDPSLTGHMRKRIGELINQPALHVRPMN